MNGKIDSIFSLMSSAFFACQLASSIPPAARESVARVASAPYFSRASRHVTNIPFDLLICDLGLPDGSGLALLTDLRLRRPLKAIALTGYGTEDDIRNSAAAGFAAHLTKPITLEQLVVAITRLFPQ